MGCQAGVSVMGVQSDGSVKGCLSLSDEFVAGNVKEKPLTEIWHNSNAFDYNRNFTTDSLKGECNVEAGAWEYQLQRQGHLMEIHIVFI
jgi:radical SAM protein with 4Fe4S-binding SPASM domain